jgi:hypothetical protein
MEAIPLGQKPALAQPPDMKRAGISYPVGHIAQQRIVASITPPAPYPSFSTFSTALAHCACEFRRPSVAKNSRFGVVNASPASW